MSETDLGMDLTRKSYREVLGHFPTGVAVVTAIAESGQPVGMAVGSFTSVSLDPPLVAFLPDKGSSTFPKIQAAGRFCVNVLSANQEQVCRIFALRGTDRFAMVGWRRAPATGAPLLENVVAWIDCELDVVHEAGDHFIVVGRVLELGVEEPAIPLLFFQGGYGGFATTSLAIGANIDLLDQLRWADRARPEMERLANDIDATCRAIAVAGEEQVIVATASAPGADMTPSRVGVRLPFRPPWGTQFLAWAPPKELDTWLERATDLDDDARAGIDEELRHLREHGWAVTYRTEHTDELDATLDAIAKYGNTPGLQRRLTQIVTRLGNHPDPADIDDENATRIRNLSMPVFDREGCVALLLVLVDLPQDLDRAGIHRIVDRLRRATEVVSAAIRANGVAG